MGTLIALDALLDARRIWRGQPSAPAPSTQPTGFIALDAALPSGGWPEAALTELLLPADGVGELRLLWPTLARLSQQGVIALIAPPYLPYAAAWAQAGLRMEHLQVVRADPRQALWAAEQCLRSAVCAAVLCWPQQANDRSLRRLQVAAESGQCLGFALRPASAAANPSPAALRIAIDADPAQLRVLKCRGGNAPPRPIPFGLPSRDVPDHSMPDHLMREHHTPDQHMPEQHSRDQRGWGTAQAEVRDGRSGRRLAGSDGPKADIVLAFDRHGSGSGSAETATPGFPHSDGTQPDVRDNAAHADADGRALDAARALLRGHPD